ncbi:hypothetical protein PAPYR_4746 [Paratrimastix pyriformis]|uniref:Gamma-secretase subunit PEN-2 n=1 Tax=Paratrimastix pyriformis TaxID=342808 RepID=A0ABQ8UJ21_9EUKA|nr:hypothetical protein PAPYR_4746 [Paratrimastix pyriformis]
MFSEQSLETPEKRLQIARRLWFLGFLLLPWCWLLNVVLFWKEAKTVPEMKKHVRRSLIGFIIVTILSLAWMFTFGFLQDMLGDFGFYLAINRPPSWHS